MVLIHLMRWLKESTDHTFEILLGKGGAITELFEEVAPTTIWPTKPEYKGRVLEMKRKVGLAPSPMDTAGLMSALRDKKFDLIYSNTAASSTVANVVKEHLDHPLITHVHELKFVIRTYCSYEETVRCLDQSAAVIACAGIVKKNLVDDCNTDPEKIHLINEFVGPRKEASTGRSVRDELGISESTFIVGGCGALGWRKGPDLFISAAAEMRARGITDFIFLWLGADQESREYVQATIEMDKYDIHDHCRFLPSVTNIEDYNQAFDVFFMSSREDPFPLVAIENGRSGNPIICFENCVGSEEYIDDSCGAVVAFGDIPAVVDAFVSFKEDSEKMKAAREEIKRRTADFTVEKCGRAVNELLLRTVKPAS